MEKNEKVLINEGLPTERSVDQLKKLRKITKKDIGDRADYGKGDNLENNNNAVDMGIESYEEYVTKNSKKNLKEVEDSRKIKPFGKF